MYMIPRSLRVTAHLKEEIVGVFGAQPPGGQNAALQPLPSALPPNDRWDRPREDQQYSIKRRGDRGDHQGRPICARIQHKCLARDGGNCSRSMAPGEAIRRPRYNSKDHQSSAGLACFVLHACVRLGARHHCFVLGVWRNFLDILDHCPHEYGGKRNIRYRDLASSCECLLPFSWRAEMGPLVRVAPSMGRSHWRTHVCLHPVWGKLPGGIKT
ncbi:hypothetical protein WJX77_011359 [Trebouxia sp. C0004]